VEDLRLTTGQTYYVSMVAYDSSYNESVASGEIAFPLTDTTPPTAPTNVDAVAGVGSVTLSWTASVSTDVKGYRVYRGTSPDVALISGNRVADETVLEEAAASFTDTTVQTCLKYYYKVTAVDCVSEGTGSNEAFGDGVGTDEDSPQSGVTNTTANESPATPPAVPAAFTAIGRDRAVELIWTNPSDADFAGVMIRYSVVGTPANPSDGELVVYRTRFLGQIFSLCGRPVNVELASRLIRAGEAVFLDEPLFVV